MSETSAPPIAPPTPVFQTLDLLTMANLRPIVRRYCRIPELSSASRQVVYSALERLLPSTLGEIQADAMQAIANGHIKYRRSHAVENDRPVKRRRVVDLPVAPDPYLNIEGRIQNLIHGDFLLAPSQSTVDTRLAQFIDASSNAALRPLPCASCARHRIHAQYKTVSVDQIPHPELLSPADPHPAQVLFKDMLLHPSSIIMEGQAIILCLECLNSLKTNTRPKFSLGNNMWVGDIPYQLSDLTLPERMLIAKYYPAAYIVKLYPKFRGSRAWDKKRLHNGLRGNVSTYRLDPQQVAGMIDGTMSVYPPNPKILSATIGVTFVGPSGITESSMPGMFRVRRWKVREALAWLKANNPLYSDIQISEPNLNALPEDGIPHEILLTVKYSSAIEQLDHEHSGYVPEESVEAEHAGVENVFSEAGLVDVEDDVSAEPSIVPIQALGVVDIEGEDITTSEMLAHALSNATVDMIPENFNITRGSAFVNEYARVDPQTGQRNDGGPSNANHLLGCFPTLFPYGRGGFETKRPIKVTYEAHARWAMEYHDRRFRKDYQFPFQVFGVMQKREVCRSACLQIRKSTFARNIALISTLRPHDFLQASREETQGIRFSNPAIRALRHELSGVRTKVKGTDDSRFSVRSKVWGTNLLFNPPSIWLTINPADTQDPIAQVFAGADDIDLDHFFATSGPDHTERAINIAQDPFASAQYFHFIVRTVFEQLFGIKRHAHGMVTREQGVLGKVQAYIGTVEAQGRGTLHLHTLIWLQDAPTSTDMKQALKSEEFRVKMTNYIQSVISANIPAKTGHEITTMQTPKDVSYDRPMDPRCTTPSQRLEKLGNLTRALQFHKCTASACLQVVQGRLVCKRRAPFPTSVGAWVDEEGNWGPQRLCEWINAFNPTVMHAIQANHDVKLVLSGKDTATITFYITNYATKKQQRSSNVSALLAKTVAFSREKDKRQIDFNLVNKRLIERCANSLTRYREFSAPEVMTYIMGWGDIYESHHYVAIYWDPVIRSLTAAYPGLQPPGHARHPLFAEQQGTQQAPADDAVQSEESPVTSTIKFIDGKPVLNDQLRDYQFRGTPLENLNFFDFLLFTYEDKAPKKKNTDNTEVGEEGDPLLSDDNHIESDREDENALQDPDHDFGQDSNGPKRGRPMNTRVRYKPGARKPKRARVIRTDGHETLPRFVGRWFPRNNGETEHEKEFYSASMLALLKPWTSLQQLKADFPSFDAAFSSFLAHSDRRVHTIVQNIEYYYECLDGAKARRQAETEAERAVLDVLPRTTVPMETEELQEMLRLSEQHVAEEVLADCDITEDDIERERLLKIPPKDRMFGSTAVIGGYDAGFFSDTPTQSVWAPLAAAATDDDHAKIQMWTRQLKETTRRMVEEDVSFDTLSSEISPSVQVARRVSQETTAQGVGPHVDVRPIDTLSSQPSDYIRPLMNMLNVEQRLAHDIVEKRLQLHVDGQNPKQLLMLLLGHGGTGKSMLISAITETFDFYGQKNILAKCATTGIAASDIGGKTVHAWAGISTNMSQEDDWLDRTTDPTSKKRLANLGNVDFAVIDEISMADKTLLYYLSAIAGRYRAKNGKGNPDAPFGGMHMILSGDFHQFPPVGNAPGALYVEREKDSARAKIGRNLFKQFETVVILDQQIRTKDQRWTDILNKLRLGVCNEDDVAEVRKLVLTNPDCDKPDFSRPPWSEAILVTSRHAVREQWNEEAIRKHCHNSGQLHYIVQAEDTVKASRMPPTARTRLAIAGMHTRKTAKLPDLVHLAIGMKAMVLMNLATDADVANGTRGTIADVILDSREPVIGEEAIESGNGVVRLKYPPALLLFKPDKPTTLRFPNVPEGLIPISPFEAAFNVRGSNGQSIRILRRQYPMTAGYAYTDYKSQGQTIEYVIIDIAQPPGLPLSPFGVYVALSRSRGRDTIRLLRDFDKHLFQKHPSDDLEKDLKRINVLNVETAEKFRNGEL